MSAEPNTPSPFESPPTGRDRWVSRSVLSRKGPTALYRVVERANPAGDYFVLKELKAGASTTTVKRFLREIEVTRVLAEQHSGIVQVVDYGGPGDGQIGSPWYVMPIAERSLEGETEFAHALDAVLELGVHLADTLAVVHAQTPSIVHRDLKPANLLQMPSGHVQIADFGIAYFEDQEGDRLTSGRAHIVGTRPFIAPELLKHGPVPGIHPRNDVYSLGKTLYAILAGGTVFEREDHRAEGFWLTKLTGDEDYEHFHGVLDRMVTARPEIDCPTWPR
jgi:eukaryotic-like serine/threonine-protein kinase